MFLCLYRRGYQPSSGFGGQFGDKFWRVEGRRRRRRRRRRRKRSGERKRWEGAG